MSAPLGLAFLLHCFGPAAEAESDASVDLEATRFRVRDPNRDLMLGVGPSIGGKLFAIGSPNPAQWAPEIGARFVFGAWRYNLLVHAAMAPLMPLRQSIATSQGGTMLEAVLAFRVMPVQHRLVRFGFWFGVAFDEIRTRIELAEADGGARGRKRVGHVGPELGTELAFPLMLPRADRAWSLDLFLAHAVRLPHTTRSSLRFEDDQGQVEMEHLAPELTVIGPFSGALVSGRVGLTFRYDLVTAGRVQPSRAGQYRSQRTAE